MHLLTLMKTDKFVFTVEPTIRKGSNSDIRCLRVELKEATQGKEILDRVLANRGQQYIELDVYAAEGNPAAEKIISRPPNPSPGSQKAFDKVKSWLTQCEQQHGDACAARHSRLPTRVVDVSDPARLRLVETGKGASGRYVTLSYCWGGAQDFLTTTETIGKRLDGFTLSDLPQTLQDAVTVTSALGIDYLWVDSICIMGDNVRDRAFEISTMGSIYKDATLTLVASKADAAGNGFLHGDSRPETGLWKALIPLAFPLPNPSAKTIQDALTMPRTVFGTVWLCDEDPSMTATFRSHVERRGWCLQEKLLSSRLLSYGRWPTWRCSLATHSDGGFYPRNAKKETHERQLVKCLSEQRRRSTGAETQQLGRTDLHTSTQCLQSWYSLLNEYTQRSLGVQSDRLPAIGGIAAEISRVTGFTYVAGLWRENLVHDLMWTCQAKEWTVRLAAFPGPTWSWASADCPVSYGEISEDALALAHVHACAVRPGASGPFGDVGTEGYVEVEAPFLQRVPREAVVRLLQDQSMVRPPPRSNDVQEWYRQIMEFIGNQPQRADRGHAAGETGGEENWQETLPEDVGAVVLFSREWKVVSETRVEGTFYSGLLVRRVGSGDGDGDGERAGFERIGAFANEERDWLDLTGSGWKRTRMVLV